MCKVYEEEGVLKAALLIYVVALMKHGRNEHIGAERQKNRARISARALHK